jgi:hypothetical protein
MAAFVRFTSPVGPVWVAKLWVERVRTPIPAEIHSGIKAAIDLSTGVQFVLETPDEVINKLVEDT